MDVFIHGEAHLKRQCPEHRLQIENLQTLLLVPGRRTIACFVRSKVQDRMDSCQRHSLGGLVRPVIDVASYRPSICGYENGENKNSNLPQHRSSVHPETGHMMIPASMMGMKLLGQGWKEQNAMQHWEGWQGSSLHSTFMASGIGM